MVLSINCFSEGEQDLLWGLQQKRLQERGTETVRLDAWQRETAKEAEGSPCTEELGDFFVSTLSSPCPALPRKARDREEQMKSHITC